MAGLLLTLAGTMSLVQTEAMGVKMATGAGSRGGEKPVILLSTKFKVPATNTFDEFSSGLTNYKVEKRRIKFGKPGE